MQDTEQNNSQLDDCWNRIGVFSRTGQNCNRLANVTHCHNCSVYSDAGKKLLDRALDSEYLAEWAKSLRTVKKKADIDITSVIVFRLGNEWYALNTRLFKEVAEIKQIHSIPHVSNNIVRGLVNIRGELELCISLGNLFRLTRGEQAKARGRIVHERLIVIQLRTGRFSFPVSEVAGIHHYHSEDVKTPPPTIHKNAKSYIEGIINLDTRHVGIMDEEKITSAIEANMK